MADSDLIKAVQQTTASVTAATVISPVFGATPVEGNLMLAFWTAPNCGLANLVTPSGWTRENDSAFNSSTAGMVCLTKVAGASESTTQTFTATANCNSRVTLFELSGVSGGTAGVSSLTSNGTAQTSATASTMGSPVDRGYFSMACFQTATASPTYLNTWTNGFTQASVVGNSHTVGTRYAPEPGTVSTQETWTTSSNFAGIRLWITPVDPLRLDITLPVEGNNATGTSVAVAGGTGSGASVPTGDIRVAFFGARNGSYTQLNTPSGWSGIDSIGETSPGLRAMYRVSDGTDTMGQTFTSTASKVLEACLFHFSKVNSETPLQVYGQTSAASGTSLSSPTLSPDEVGGMVVGAYQAGSSSYAAGFFTNGFRQGYPGFTMTSMYQYVVDIEDHVTTHDWTPSSAMVCIAVIIKHTLQPIVAGDGWGISS